MAEKIKFTQKDLKAPDKFRAFVADALDKAANNFNKILYAVGLIILILIFIYVISSYQKNKTLKAGEMFEDALTQYKIGNTDTALLGFTGLIEKYPGQQPARLARYYAGNIYYDLGRYELSIEHMKEYLDSSPKNKLLEDSANLTIGLAFYNLEKWQEAVDYLIRLQNSESPYHRQAKINLGLSYEKLGEYDKAQEIYKSVLSNDI